MSEQPGTAEWKQAQSDASVDQRVAPLVAPRRIGPFEPLAKPTMPGKIIGRVPLVDRATGDTIGYLPVYGP